MQSNVLNCWGLVLQATVKLFCPKCEDIYFPRSKYQVRLRDLLLSWCLCCMDRSSVS